MVHAANRRAGWIMSTPSAEGVCAPDPTLEPANLKVVVAKLVPPTEGGSGGRPGVESRRW